jgi:protein O-GlcNAc transferase
MADHPATAAARTLLNAGKFEQARADLQRALQKSPGDPSLCYFMSVTLSMLGQGPQSIYYAQRACEADPKRGLYRAALGEARLFAGDTEAAAADLREAIRIDPSQVAARINLSNVHVSRLEYAAAETLLREALALRPDVGEISNNLGNILLDTCRQDEAIGVLRRRVEAVPADLVSLASLASAMNYSPSVAPADAAAMHRRYGEALVSALGLAGKRRPSPPPVPTDRPLNIAFLSPDFRQHSVAYFLLPLLRTLDRRAFRVHAYSLVVTPDQRTQEFRSLVDVWRDVSRASDAAILAHARADKLDIAVDLAGLTLGHRAPLLCQGLAPRQLTYLGYPSTTGLAPIDARIVDAITDPPAHDSLLVERPLRIAPCFLCYDRANVPAAAPPRADGPFTFASFNVLSKLNDAVIDSWARIVRSVPGSRLLLKARTLGDEATRERAARAFADRGLSPDRLELIAHLPSHADHLAVYQRVDVALDPFPYNGTTTTCEALAQGVPVVTLAGAAHAGRVGASLLNAVGLGDLVGADLPTYERLAADLAASPERLASYRQTLPTRLAGSALCDQPAFSAAFASAVRTFCTNPGV